MEKITLTLALSAAVIATAQAQSTGLTMPIELNLEGNHVMDGWTDLSGAANPGYPGYPGTSPWPNPIQSNVGGDASVNKLANGAGGGVYPGSAGLYFGGFSTTPNTLGGTLGVSDATPVANLNTVIFQIQIGEALGHDLWNDAGAVLSYNGGNQQLAANFRSLVAQEDVGTFNAPTGPEPLYNNLHAFQWDLSGINDPITSYTISFSGVQHAQIYGLQLDQTDAVYQTEVVPEPATMAVLGLGALAALRRRKKA